MGGLPRSVLPSFVNTSVHRTHWLISAQAAVQAEAAMQSTDEQVAKLSNDLEEAKAACAGSGSEEGTFWWLDREFDESLKYMGIGFLLS